MRGPQREQLIWCDLTVENVPVGHTVSLLNVLGAEYLPVQDSIGEIGGELGHGRNDVVCHLIFHVIRPFASFQVIGGILAEHRYRMVAGRGHSRIGSRLHVCLDIRLFREFTACGVFEGFLHPISCRADITRTCVL